MSKEDLGVLALHFPYACVMMWAKLIRRALIWLLKFYITKSSLPFPLFDIAGAHAKYALLNVWCV